MNVTRSKLPRPSAVAKSAWTASTPTTSTAWLDAARVRVERRAGPAGLLHPRREDAQPAAHVEHGPRRPPRCSAQKRWMRATRCTLSEPSGGRAMIRSKVSRAGRRRRSSPCTRPRTDATGRARARRRSARSSRSAGTRARSARRRAAGTASRPPAAPRTGRPSRGARSRTAGSSPGRSPEVLLADRLAVRHGAPERPAQQAALLPRRQAVARAASRSGRARRGRSRPAGRAPPRSRAGPRRRSSSSAGWTRLSGAPRSVHARLTRGHQLAQLVRVRRQLVVAEVREVVRQRDVLLEDGGAERRRQRRRPRCRACGPSSRPGSRARCASVGIAARFTCSARARVGRDGVQEGQARARPAAACLDALLHGRGPRRGPAARSTRSAAGPPSASRSSSGRKSLSPDATL